MSSFAKTKCPKCGRVIQHHLGGFGFYGQETTKCSSCGYTYDSVQNCIEDIPDRDDRPVARSIIKEEIDLSTVSTDKLLEELRKRSYK